MYNTLALSVPSPKEQIYNKQIHNMTVSMYTYIHWHSLHAKGRIVALRQV